MSNELVPKRALERLRVLFDSYSNGHDEYLLHSTRLKVEEWSKSYAYKRKKDDLMDVLSHNNAALVSLGTPRISRMQVFEIFANKEFSQLERFVATMAWGFKPDSYGPYRTSVMISKPRKNRTVEEVLDSVAYSNDPIDAYRKLANALEGLGPAFGTKFMYFTSSEKDRAPILDAVVGNWLTRYGVHDAKHRSISSLGWNIKNYEHYVRFCTEICERLGINDRGLVEYLMFVDSQYSDYLDQGTVHPKWVTSVESAGWQI